MLWGHYTTEILEPSCTSSSCGGLYTHSTQTITNSTISGNSARIASGGLCGLATLQNTILALNTVMFGPGADCTGPVTSLGSNLIGDPTGCTITLQPSDLPGSPGLGAFTDDGTPGQGHFPLLPTSQAIDAGNDAACPPTDQLGQPRVGRCDIGAIEFQPAVLTVVIDIQPGVDPPRINPRSSGKIRLAILTTLTFDATAVNAATVRFGRTGTEAAAGQVVLEDVNGDGFTDMLLSFNIQATGIQCGDTTAVLAGMTVDGQAIQGAETMQTSGCRRH